MKRLTSYVMKRRREMEWAVRNMWEIIRALGLFETRAVFPLSSMFMSLICISSLNYSNRAFHVIVKVQKDSNQPQHFMSFPRCRQCQGL